MDNPLLAVLILLVVAVALVPVFKWIGLGTVLGYLAAGIVVGPYGLKLIADSEALHSVSEFGIVVMLFLVGLEVQPRELWRLRHKVLGLGVGQMAATSAAIAALLLLLGWQWQLAVVLGLALAMSSTAIAMQVVGQRSLTVTDTGRATLVTLLVQDLAVIPVLALIPVLAATRRVEPNIVTDIETAVEAVGNPYDWWIALVIVGGFVGVTLASRYLMPYVMRWVAASKIPEGFTALGLLLVIGTAFGAQALGLSPALGAFFAGVLLADSEYRHELESNLEPFKGLLLGLFFISVGMGIAFSVLIDEPLRVLALVAAIVGIKIAVLYVLATFFRMHVADRVLLALLLCQAGEFAFVVIEFGYSARLLSEADEHLWSVVVAISMALTPVLLLAFDRLAVPHMNSRRPEPAVPEGMPNGHKVIVLGYGRFGQIITRLLRAQGYSMTLIDDDPAQIALMQRFGVKVFYGDGGRLDILRAAGAADAEMIVIAVAGGERILEIADLIRSHLPRVKIAARAVDRGHAHALMAMGVETLERETFRGAIRLGEKALTALGHDPEESRRMAQTFEEHDERLLHDSYSLREDRDAYIGFVRRSTEMLDQVMRADRENVGRVRPADRPDGKPPSA